MVQNILYSATRKIWVFKMKAKKAVELTILAVAVGLGTTSCGVIPGTSQETIEPGHTGLRIQLYGGEKGVQNAEVITGGRVWYNGWTEKIVVFPTFIKQYSFTEDATEGSPNNTQYISFRVVFEHSEV